MSNQITELDIDQIQKRIPHRPPMLLIERVEEIVPDHSAVGVKMVSVGESNSSSHRSNVHSTETFPEHVNCAG